VTWYVDFFQSGHYQRIYPFEPERSAREAAFAKLVLPQGGRILDLCCGAGRHLRHLRAVGIDRHLPSLRALPAACADMRARPALAGFVESVQRVDDDGTLVAEQRRFDVLKSRLTTSFVIFGPSGERIDSEGHSLRLYTLTELAGMLAASGLALQNVYGGFSGEPYSLTSVRMIAVALK
jgi:hypothetical protein